MVDCLAKLTACHTIATAIEYVIIVCVLGPLLFGLVEQVDLCSLLQFKIPIK